MMTSSTPSTTTDASQEAQGADLPASQGSEVPEGPTTKQDAVKRAYSEAAAALREKYRAEFNADVQQRVKDYGFEWSPKPTAAEKARSEIARLAKEAGLSQADIAGLVQ